jgi:hypothetical protein
VQGPAPSNVVDTTAILFITSLLQQTDFIYAMPTEVARYYTQARLMDILPIELPCRMAGFASSRARTTCSRQAPTWYCKPSVKWPK